MIADFYTKLLQGENYYKLKQVIMGHDNMPVDERVGEDNKKATGHTTINSVSRNKGKVRGDYEYKVSNNFN